MRRSQLFTRAREHAPSIDDYGHWAGLSIPSDEAEDHVMTPSEERASLAEGIMWDYEPDFMPEGMEILDRKDLLMWKRPHGPLAQRRWSNVISYVRTTSDQIERTIDEAFAFFGPVVFTWVVGPTSSPRVARGS